MAVIRSTGSFRNGGLRSVAQRQKYAGGYSDIRCDITLVILGTYGLILLLYCACYCAEDILMVQYRQIVTELRDRRDAS